MPTMTTKQMQAFRFIFAEAQAGGLKVGNFTEAKEADLMLMAMQFYNQGVGAALDALDLALDSCTESHLVGWVTHRIEEVREETVLKNG